MLLNFVSGSRVELMYLPLIIFIRSRLVHLDGFQLLVLLPQLIEIISFVCKNNTSSLNLKWSWDRLVIVTKGFYKLPNLLMLVKRKIITSQKLVSGDFWRIATVFSKGKSALPPLFNGREVLSSASDPVFINQKQLKLCSWNFVLLYKIKLPTFPEKKIKLKTKNLSFAHVKIPILKDGQTLQTSDYGKNRIGAMFNSL